MADLNGFLAQITPVVLTYNEAPNIARVLDKLSWARQVVVVDSGSDDETGAICASYPNVRVVNRKFDSHAQQWNFAIADTGIADDWVLALDADYVLTDNLIREIAALTPSTEVAGYQTCFRYCIQGRPLRGTLYPPVITLFRRSRSRYQQDGHTQRLQVDGQVKHLVGLVFHDDRKPLGRWLWAQDRYARLEAEELMSKPFGELRLQDRLRRMIVITPWLVPLYCLTVGRGIFDGWAGLHYAFQRGVAESILAIKLIEHRLAQFR
jgi:glycosyltransferase involved in cell wall biosynthesis